MWRKKTHVLPRHCAHLCLSCRRLEETTRDKAKRISHELCQHNKYYWPSLASLPMYAESQREWPETQTSACGGIGTPPALVGCSNLLGVRPSWCRNKALDCSDGRQLAKCGSSATEMSRVDQSHIYRYGAYIRCVYRDFRKHTVIYGVHIRTWPALAMLQHDKPSRGRQVQVARHMYNCS